MSQAMGREIRHKLDLLPVASFGNPDAVTAGEARFPASRGLCGFYLATAGAAGVMIGLTNFFTTESTSRLPAP